MAAFTDDDKLATLEALGDEGTVRGQSTLIIIQRSVGRLGQNGELVETRSRAIIDSDLKAEEDDPVVVGNESWKVHSIDWDDGIFMAVWLR